MRALSIQQPWAWLIVNGYKFIENRTWSTNVRGLIAVHAGKKIDYDAVDWIRKHRPAVPLPDTFECGGLVGEVTITDCVTHSNDPYFFGPFGFVLKDGRAREFYPCRGMLGFFIITDEFIAEWS